MRPVLILALLLCGPARATESMQPYAIGDRVTIVDGAGVEHVATLTGFEDGKVKVAVYEEPFTFPAANVLRKAGWMERLVSFYSDDKTRGQQAVNTGAGIVAIVAAVVAADEVDVSGDDGEERVPAQDVEAAALAAEQSAIINGPSVPIRYTISGTFAAPPEYSAGGTWTPSITFGLPAGGFKGGTVEMTTAAPVWPGGAPQVILGGSWVQVTKDELHVSGTLDRYAGKWRVVGNDLVRGPVTFRGGVVQAYGVEE